MPATNFPNGINVVDNSTIDDADGNLYCNNITVNEDATIEGNLDLTGDIDITGDISATTLTLTPTSTGNVINSNANSDAVGNVFCYIGNTGGTGSAGHSCGYKTGSYNGGEIGLISNGDDVTFNGIAINSVGIYCTDKDFYITGNEGTASTYSTFLAIDNSATGGCTLAARSDGVQPSAGYVGQIISDNVALNEAITLDNGDYNDVTSISLTAGNWMISGSVTFETTSGNYTIRAGIGTASGNVDTGLIFGVNTVELSAITIDSNLETFPLNTPIYFVSISATQIYYLKAFVANGNTTTAYGSISAMRLL